MKPFFWSTMAFLTAINVHHTWTAPSSEIIPGTATELVSSASYPYGLAVLADEAPTEAAARVLKHRTSNRHAFKQ